MMAVTKEKMHFNLKKAVGVDEIVQDAESMRLEEKGGISLVDMASFDESCLRPVDCTRSPRATAFLRLNNGAPAYQRILSLSKDCAQQDLNLQPPDP